MFQGHSQAKGILQTGQCLYSPFHKLQFDGKSAGHQYSQGPDEWMPGAFAV